MAGHDNWLTPPELWAILDDEFSFDLDASASPDHAKCARYITPEQDALRTPWRGRVVWCNPPYTQIGAFVYRAWEQCQAQKSTVVLLIPAYTDPLYWWDCIVPNADEIRFLKGRLSFRERALQGKRESARFPSVVLVFRYHCGEMRGSPRVWWWDWKKLTAVEDVAPLFAPAQAWGEPEATNAVDPVGRTGQEGPTRDG